MKYKPLEADLFRNNRKRLMARLAPKSLAAINANDIMPTNADGTMGFRQNSDLFYLSGIEQEETILLLFPDAADPGLREILFLREPKPELELWEGHKLSKEEAQGISGVASVKWLSDFQALFHRLICEADRVYLNSNEHKRSMSPVETRELRFIRDCQRQYPLHTYQRLAPLMHSLRWTKSDEEMDLIRRAAELTDRGFRRVLRFVKPGVNEMEVEAEFAHEFIRAGGEFAYPPIIASGRNACVLHYVKNDQICRRGDLLLLDVAAVYANYAADMTRTIPVNGRFSRRQRRVYQSVLRVMRETSRAMVSGTLLKEIQSAAEEAIGRELVDLGLLKSSELRRKKGETLSPVKRYFMHGVAHPLGLDVHDVGLAEEPISAGTVLTCEPAIYLPDEGFGIRLENDYMVTDGNPVDLLGDTPVEPDEIEAAMAAGN